MWNFVAQACVGVLIWETLVPEDRKQEVRQLCIHLRDKAVEGSEGTVRGAKKEKDTTGG